LWAVAVLVAARLVVAVALAALCMNLAIVLRRARVFRLMWVLEE